jgi:hypothetical protein
MNLLAIAREFRPKLDELREQFQGVVDKLEYLGGKGENGTPEELSVLTSYENARKLMPPTASQRFRKILSNMTYGEIIHGEEFSVYGAELEYREHKVLDHLKEISAIFNHENNDDSEMFDMPRVDPIFFARLPTLPHVQDLFVFYFESFKKGKIEQVDDALDACLDGILDCVEAYLDLTGNLGPTVKSANKK